MAGPRALARHNPGGVPEGYESRTSATAKALVCPAASDWLDSVLASGATLHQWAAGHDDRAHFVGRGTVYSIPAPTPGPDARKRWVVRHFERGGAMAMHMRDRYLRVGRLRPWRELAASVTARTRGVRTPAVVCAVAYPDGVCYRADMVTEAVPDARTLADTLLDHDGSRGWLVAMSRAGEVIRRLAELGVFHVDLNAHNILFPSGPDAECFVVDLDRARILRRRSPSARERMQARLTRSIMKIGTPTGEHLGHSEIEAALNRPVEDV